MDYQKIAKNLAHNIVALRRKRGLSQAALSTKSGVPRSTIASLESGDANPTLQIILALCDVLNVSVDEALAKPRGDYKLIRASDVPVKTNPKGDVKQYKLLPDAIYGMEIDRMEFLADARLKGTPHVDHTKEYLSCVSGRITLYVDGNVFELKPGDVLAFPGDRPHSYHNPGTNKAVGFSVVLPSAQKK